VRWDAMSPTELATVAERAAARGHAIYAILLSQEVEQARSRVPGTWTLVARVDGGVTIWSIAASSRARCPGGATPIPETCNGVDDDCNGRVDDLTRSSYTDTAIPLAALQAENAGCTPSAESTWLACNNAFHLHCRDLGCRTSGVGALEWGPADSATAACVSAELPRDVTPNELARFGSCPLGRSLVPSDRLACATAIHGYCRSLGRYASGFGPVAAAGADRWSVVCLEPAAANAVVTTYPTLATFHDSCNGPRAPRETPSYCMSAANRLCISSGYAAGFGPVADADGRSPTVICLDY
jgi:hypothetical protein